MHPETQQDNAETPEIRPRCPRWCRAVLLGLAHAALLALSNAPFDLWWVGLIAPAPLVWLALRPGMPPSRAGFWGAIGTSPWWVMSHLWVSSISTAGVVPLVIYLSLWSMLFVWIAGRVVASRPGFVVFSVPVVWVGLEYLRGSVLFSGYAWFLAGHPMIDSPGAGLAHPASWGGAYLVSWVVLLGVVAGTQLSVKRTGVTPRLFARIGFAIWAIWLALGFTVWRNGSESEAPSLKVAVVQSNVPQSNKTGWTPTQRYLDWLDLRELTLQAAQHNPDLIVWPETMFPGISLDAESLAAEYQASLQWPIDREADPRLLDIGDLIGTTDIAYELLSLQRGLGIPMLVGALGYEELEFVFEPDGRVRTEWDNQFNSVLLLRNGEASQTRYDKVRLMAFGEVIPYVSWWPWLEQKILTIGAQGMSFTLSAGTRHTRFDVTEDARVATPICFESTMPSICRRLVFREGRRRAGVMINPSNDGWFGASVAMREHYLRATRWRCVELATPMVRACNTGISAVIDHRGRVTQNGLTSPAGGRAHVAGLLVAEVALGQGATVYARVGDLFGGSAAFATALFVVVGVSGIGRRKGTGHETSPTEG